METLSEKSERSDRYKLRSVGFCDLRHTLSAALSFERCSRRTSDSQGAEGVVRAGLEDKGQKVSKQDIRVEQKVSVALLASRVKWYKKCLNYNFKRLGIFLQLGTERQEWRYSWIKLQKAMMQLNK